MGYHLWSDLATNEDWLPGINVATCRGVNRHRAKANDPKLRIPVESCGCGFWFYRDFEELLLDWDQYVNPVPVSGSAGLWGFSPADHTAFPLLGRVEGGGRVIEGELGFRAAQARVIELYDEGADPRIAAVAERFGVPVKPYPWPTVTGMAEIHDRPGLPSLVKLWTGEQTVMFFERPGSAAYEALSRAGALVTVVYRRDRIGEARVPRLLRVDEI